MAQEEFTATINKWVAQTEERILAVFRTAAQYVIEDVRDRTPVDTGYLQNSLTVTLDRPELMLGFRGDGYVADPYALTIAGAEIGDTIYASFVAEYAAHVEYGTAYMQGRGMVRLAAQAWPKHVRRASAEAKASVH